MRPGGGFVVGGAVAQAAVEDADEAVGQCAECLVVGGAAGAVVVVERPRSWRGVQRGEGLLVQGVGPRVTHYYDRAWEASEDRRTRLVVIGLKGLDRAAVERILTA